MYFTHIISYVVTHTVIILRNTTSNTKGVRSLFLGLKRGYAIAVHKQVECLLILLRY